MVIRGHLNDLCLVFLRIPYGPSLSCGSGLQLHEDVSIRHNAADRYCASDDICTAER